MTFYNGYNIYELVKGLHKERIDVMKKNLKSGWCKVFNFCYKLFVILCVISCFSFGASPLEEEMIKKNSNSYVEMYEAFVNKDKGLFEMSLSSISANDKSIKEDLCSEDSFEPWKKKTFFKSLLCCFQTENSVFTSLSYTKKRIEERKNMRLQFENLCPCPDSVGLSSEQWSLFNAFLDLDTAQDENRKEEFFKKLDSIKNGFNECDPMNIDQNFSGEYFNIEDETKKSIKGAFIEIKKEMNDFDLLFADCLSATSKNNSLFLSERLIILFKPWVPLCLSIAVFVYASTAKKFVCYEKNQDLRNVTIDDFNKNYSDLSGVTVKLISESLVLFYTSNPIDCYKTNISPVEIAIATFAGAVALVFADFYISSIHQLIYLVNIKFYKINIEQPSKFLVMKIFENFSFHKRNENEQKKIVKSVTDALPEILKKRVFLKSVLKKIDKIHGAY